MENQIKSSLSRHFIEIIASRKGYKCAVPSPDTGVDLSVTRTKPREENGKLRYFDTGEYIEIQLKSTTESNVKREGRFIKYDLEVKNYNDLITRKGSGRLVPLYLVLFILPDDNTQWVQILEDYLSLKKHAFWYLPETGSEISTNVSTIQIQIPLEQKVDLSFLCNCFREVYE